MTHETYSNFKNLKKPVLVFQVRAYIKTPFSGDELKKMTRKQLLKIALESEEINSISYLLEYKIGDERNDKNAGYKI